MSVEPLPGETFSSYLERKLRQQLESGGDWYRAPLPRLIHRCRPAQSGYASMSLVERCACGAIRMGGRFWLEKNSRRRWRLFK